MSVVGLHIHVGSFRIGHLQFFCISPPPCPHSGLIYTIKFTQPSLTSSAIPEPPPPSSADTIYGSPLEVYLSGR